MRGLLSGWKEQRSRGASTLQQVTPTPFDFKGFAPPDDTGAESVIGNDDSVIVNDTANAPWRPLVCMRIQAPGEFLIGSGLLIRPDAILTAAHNVYRLNSKAYATSIIAHVGVTPAGKAGAEAVGARVQCPPQYVACTGPNDPTRYAYDFAVIHLSSDALGKWTRLDSIPDILSQPPMSEPDLRAAHLTLAGYPVYQNQPICLRKCLGRIGSTTGTGLIYDMDSLPGQSGGPVFRVNEPSKSISFAGVHTTGQEVENRARRWDATMQKTVKDWLGGGRSSAAIA